MLRSAWADALSMTGERFRVQDQAKLAPASLTSLELMSQLGFHCWPLGIDDAVIDRMADAASPGDDVVAKDALLLCTDSQQGGA